MAISSTPDSLQADARPIAFTLHNTAVDGAPEVFPLFVRPEDLSIAYPSRLAITQTFGEDGAWADSFGQGVKTISLSGVTGWGGPRVNGGDDDGYQHFAKLHKTVFTEWHRLRDEVAKSGQDPDKVLLILSDGLDNLNWVIAPQQFVLKRNKSRPLLAQYAITMHMLRDHGSEKAKSKPSTEEQALSAIESLEASVAKLDAFCTSIKTMVSSVLAPIKAAIASFVALTARIARAVISAVRSIVGVVSGVVGEFIGMAQNIMRAGMNIAQAVAAVTTLPQQIKAQFQALSSAYTNMMCVLKNVFKKRTFLPDYDIYGSGNCASTSGGHAVSSYVSSNTFAAVLKTDKATVAVTKSGAAAVSQGANMDPTTTTLSTAGATAGSIASGVSFQ